MSGLNEEFNAKSIIHIDMIVSMPQSKSEKIQALKINR